MREDAVLVAEHVVAQVNWFEEQGDKWYLGTNSTCTGEHMYHGPVVLTFFSK